MLTLPVIAARPAQPYVAVPVKVRMADMVPVIDRSFATLYAWLGQKGLEPSGPAFFRYRVIDMNGLMELDLASPVAEAVKVEDGEPVVSGMLPAGRYAEVTWTGSYQHLMDVNAVLVGWAKEKGVTWDMENTPEGNRFTARIEIYVNNPAEVSKPDDLVTTVAIKVAG